MTKADLLGEIGIAKSESVHLTVLAVKRPPASLKPDLGVLSAKSRFKLSVGQLFGLNVAKTQISAKKSYRILPNARV